MSLAARESAKGLHGGHGHGRRHHGSQEQELRGGVPVGRTTITVGEQGTLAAAATEIAVGDTGAPPEPQHQFIADRPFLMIVEETTTGWDLFQTVVRTID